MIWSALAGGALFQGRDERAQRVNQTLEQLAISWKPHRPVSLLAWILRLPVKPPVLTGSSRVTALQGGGASHRAATQSCAMV